jgi:hypothetical protein
MRFITEFELEATQSPEWHIEHSQRRMGEMLQDCFGLWESNFISRTGASAVKRSLEIEAFPMDKWIGFKKRVLNHLLRSKTTMKLCAEVEQMFKELESFGKPAGDAK